MYDFFTASIFEVLLDNLNIPNFPQIIEKNHEGHNRCMNKQRT